MIDDVYQITGISDIVRGQTDAGETATAQQIETVDMARRAIHNQGADMLKERLEGKIDIDFDTSRRLFTLICVLHIKG